MKNKKIKIFLYLIILFVSIKCEIEYETKIINNEAITIDNLTESKYYYHILFESQSNIPNYLKIISKKKMKIQIITNMLYHIMGKIQLLQKEFNYLNYPIHL